MSGCQIKRDFCVYHKAWVILPGHLQCPVGALQAEVERLTAALADRDRRINKALALHAERAVGDLHYCQSCMADATGEYEYPCPTVQALRGES